MKIVLFPSNVRSIALGLAIFISAPCAFADVRCTQLAQLEVSEAVRAFNSDPKRALVLLTKANILGNPDAAFNLGLLHMNGVGVTKSDTNAIPFFRKAANCGHTPAQFNLAQILFDSASGKAEAARWFAAAASGGHTIAAYNLGLMHTQGVGVQKDMEKAKIYFSQAASGGHANAMYNLGHIYDEVGTSGQADYTLALRYYTMAAQREHAAAQSKLAVFYGLGKGVKKDQKVATYWLQRAATNGDRDANRILNSLVEPMK